LLKHEYGTVLYTGNGMVGRIAMGAAAKTLTPVVLELGGKCPVIVDSTVDLEAACHRILWAKFLNAGQTCTSPDHVLVTKDVADAFIATARKTLQGFYGDDPKSSPDFGRIINERHWGRLHDMMKSADEEGGTKWVSGGPALADVGGKYIPPTMAVTTNESALMQGEIFGPILPVVTVNSVQHAIDILNAREHPLALYVFSKDRATVRRVLDSTHSGACVANDLIVHQGMSVLPFGGTGPSGMGVYRGRDGFLCFSHARAVVHKGGRLGDTAHGLEKWLGRFPPYKGDARGMRFLLTLPLTVGDVARGATLLLTAAVGAAAGILAYQHFGTQA
jgi:aldehyde dehydrogenase (NAD+)